jgi:hypothetical protein
VPINRAIDPPRELARHADAVRSLPTKSVDLGINGSTVNLPCEVFLSQHSEPLGVLGRVSV